MSSNQTSPATSVPTITLYQLDPTGLAVPIAQSSEPEAEGSKPSVTQLNPTTSNTENMPEVVKQEPILYEEPIAVKLESDLVPTPSSSEKRTLKRSLPTRTTRSSKRIKLSPSPLRDIKGSSPLTDLEEYPACLPLPAPDLEFETKPDLSTKPKRSTKKPTVRLKLDKPHPAPAKWEKQYEMIEMMRRGIVAPVDTMGCETPNGERTTDPKTIRFHVLISLMLSSQTKDPVTSQAVTNLHNTLPGGLTASSLSLASQETVEGCINKVGFWRRKTEYIQSAAQMILKGGLDEGEDLPEGTEDGWVGEEEGDIPRTLGGLCKLKGVGPKMAFLALQCGWNINAGIGVDVHVHRITNRLGWHKPKTTDPEQTRLNLQSWLPPRLFKPINHVLVGFGQVVCLPVGPRCDVCTLGKEKACPSRVANVNSKGRKVVEFTTLEETREDMPAKMKVEVGYEA